MKREFSFELIAKDSETLARTGRISTAHGIIETPVFMPVGTQGSVKALTQQMLEELGAGIILGNTYHLYLRPTHTLINQLGGLHQFMSWNRAILTDSGGFQVQPQPASQTHGRRRAVSIAHRRFAPFPDPGKVNGDTSRAWF